jgi:hypothetical protein
MAVGCGATSLHTQSFCIPNTKRVRETNGSPASKVTAEMSVGWACRDNTAFLSKDRRAYAPETPCFPGREDRKFPVYS